MNKTAQNDQIRRVLWNKSSLVDLVFDNDLLYSAEVYNYSGYSPYTVKQLLSVSGEKSVVDDFGFNSYTIFDYYRKKTFPIKEINGEYDIDVLANLLSKFEFEQFLIIEWEQDYYRFSSFSKNLGLDYIEESTENPIEMVSELESIYSTLENVIRVSNIKDLGLDPNLTTGIIFTGEIIHLANNQKYELINKLISSIGKYLPTFSEIIFDRYQLLPYSNILPKNFISLNKGELFEREYLYLVNFANTINRSTFSLTDLSEKIIDYHYINNQINLYEIKETSISIERSDISLKPGKLWLFKGSDTQRDEIGKLDQFTEIRSEKFLYKPLSSHRKLSDRQKKMILTEINESEPSHFIDLGGDFSKKNLLVVNSQTVKKGEVIYESDNKFSKNFIQSSTTGKINLDSIDIGLVKIEDSKTTIQSEFSRLPNKIESLDFVPIPLTKVYGENLKLGKLKCINVSEIANVRNMIQKGDVVLMILDIDLRESDLTKLLSLGVSGIMFSREPNIELPKRHFELVTYATLAGGDAENYFVELVANHDNGLVLINPINNELDLLLEFGDYSFKNMVEKIRDVDLYQFVKPRKGDIVMSISGGEHKIGKILYLLNENKAYIKPIKSNEDSVEMFSDYLNNLILI